MAFVTLALAAALTAAAPTAKPDEAPTVRCRPAPYIVAEKREDRPTKQTLALQARGYMSLDRNGRPCLLMRGEATPSRGQRIAALS
jgi:hypothetical protein